ncbi:hypothetical protein V8E53_001679 [Lactarius tabidus]
MHPCPSAKTYSHSHHHHRRSITHPMSSAVWSPTSQSSASTRFTAAVLRLVEQSLGLGRSGLLKRFCSTSPYIGYVGGSVHLPSDSEAEGAKGGAELATLHTVSASARLTASSEENPRGPTLPAAGGADALVDGWKGGGSHAVAILAA